MRNANPVPPPPIGWPLLPVPDENGELHFTDLETSVRDTIKAILQTQRGEQLMRPEFGGDLPSFLRRPNSIQTRRELRDAVQEAIARWERRAILDRVEVWEVPDRPTHVRVEIAYRLRRTGSSQALALTMQLAS